MRLSSPPEATRSLAEVSAGLCRNRAGSGVIGVAGHGAPAVGNWGKHHAEYMLMIYGNEAAVQSASTHAVEQMHAAYGAYTGALQEAGVIRGGPERLRPTSAASTVRVAGGKTQVLDGALR